MPSFHHVLKSVNSQPGIKSKLKSLLGKSSTFPLFSKPGLVDPLTRTWLPSASFRSFQCEILKFSSRIWEINESEKPLSVSEAISRVFATPSIHGPMWQVLSYGTQRVFDESTAVNLQNSGHLAASALPCKITGAKHANLEAKLMRALESQTGSFVFRVSLRQKPWRESKSFVREDFTSFATFNPVDLECTPQIGWNCELEETKSLQGEDVLTCTFPSTLTDFYRFYCDLCQAALSNSLGSSMHDNEDLKVGSFLLDSTPGITVLDKSTVVSNRGLRLRSGACYFPHPEKELTGGEDAYFICPEKQVFGVADGVGGWAEVGVDSGAYARQLMSESLIAAQEEPSGSVDAARVLKKAYYKTTCRGSSTACILALSTYGLQAVNLGDSGFIVVRNGRMIFKSPVQQHNFNFPFQLESCGAGDPVSAAELFVVEVVAEDVIVAGTDGLFDNLFAAEIENIVLQAKWSGMSPAVTAQKIAYLARERAKDSHGPTPFSTAAQNAGYFFNGGKMDDITVIVSFVTDQCLG